MFRVDFEDLNKTMAIRFRRNADKQTACDFSIGPLGTPTKDLEPVISTVAGRWHTDKFDKVIGQKTSLARTLNQYSASFGMLGIVQCSPEELENLKNLFVPLSKDHKIQIWQAWKDWVIKNGIRTTFDMNLILRDANE